MMTTKEASIHNTPKQSRAQAGEVATAQKANELSRSIAVGPVMAAQRKSMDQMTSSVGLIQRQGLPEEDELFQGKFAAQFQPVEEEELMQGTFDSRLPLTASKKDG